MEREVEVVFGQKAVSVSIGSSATRPGSLQDEGVVPDLGRGRYGEKGKVLTGRSLIGEEWEAFDEAVVAAMYGCKADSHNIKGS